MEKKYLIIGCARSGVAVANFLLAKGKKVILSDNKDYDDVVSSFPEIINLGYNKDIIFDFGGQPNEIILEQVEEIIVSPGVPLDLPIIKKAEKMKIKIISEIELAYRYINAPIIAITGTNGKTTTTTLTGEIYKNSGRKTYVVGNIGDPIIKYVEESNEKDIFIAEISSFQLETIEDFKPYISTILNITPDHLDRHKNMENYIKAKCRVFENALEEDLFLINLDDPILSKMKITNRCNNIYFSIKNKVKRGAFLEDGIIKVADGEKTLQVCNAKDLKIPGIHNIKNALASVALAYYGGVEIDVIRDTLKDFKGVEHRLELVRVLDDIAFINDSKGTNTDASSIAIKAIDTPIILIAGGYDKNIDFDGWINSFENKVRYLIVMGETSNKITEAALKNGYNNVIQVDSLERAIEKAYEKSKKGDTILLSPACASWDMFKNFEERGELFKEIVNDLGGK
ncbi:MAG: UDP-N-acetylmuramoyl-L-alanine--D-glutamate ligase [Eubacteriaceae bacterium]